MEFSVKKINQVDSSLVCEYIAERHGPISHLKLQKLLFYTEAFHLATFDQSLVIDNFEAWLHGPVSRIVYNQLKEHSILYDELQYSASEGSQLPSIRIKEALTIDQLEIVNSVIDEYGKLSSSQLENLTHSEYPWQYARKGFGEGDRCEVIIPKPIIRDYYKKQLYGDED